MLRGGFLKGGIMDSQTAIALSDTGCAAVGGRTTLSPPSKRLQVFQEQGHVLASGTDGLVLAIDLVWRDEKFFQKLQRLKKEALLKKKPVPLHLKSLDGAHELAFEVRPHGKQGYEWMLHSAEYDIQLGAWLRPTDRPSAMIEVRASALWLYGPIEAADRLALLLQGAGAFVNVAKVSRVDLCADIFVTDDMWCNQFFEHIVTRASDTSLHNRNRELTGIQIGKGEILGRIYDKAAEMIKRPHKAWMYDIWNIDCVHEGYRAVRVEFQIRREVLRELAIDTIWDFFSHPRSLWAYCVQKWLKFTDDPELDSRDQKLLPFWKTVQEAFAGVQSGIPLIRAKMVQLKQKQMAQQMLGQLTSIIATKCDTAHPSLSLTDPIPNQEESAELIGMTDAVLSEKVRMKIGRHMREREKFELAQATRKSLKLPSVNKP